MSYIKAYEYENNVNPKMKSIPITRKNIHDCDYGHLRIVIMLVMLLVL